MDFNSATMQLRELMLEEIKDMFLMYRVGKLELSAKWLAQVLDNLASCRITPMNVSDFLQSSGDSPGNAPKRICIPIEANYEQLDAQGHPAITAYHCEVARPYTLLVQDWLTAEELQVFASPVPGSELLLQPTA